MKRRYLILLILQLAFIFTAGMISKDSNISIMIALIGVAFNFLVSLNIPYGFLFGVIYAIANGVISFYSSAYASFAFMIFLQAPMAAYSFIAWKKKKTLSDKIMKIMTYPQMIVFIILLFLAGNRIFLILFFITGKIEIGRVFDVIFFLFSAAACLLLAFCFKSAYIITLLSGIGGTMLWLYHTLADGTGFSLCIFYFIVAINSIIAVHDQYFSDTLNKKNISYKTL